MPVRRRIRGGVARAAARAHARLRGSGRFDALHELDRNERSDPIALERYTRARLRELVAHAYETTPYYREVMTQRGLAPEDIDGPADLERLPVLTRRIVRERFDDLVSRTRRGDARSITTSGSTGEPLRLLTTREMHDWHDAAKLRAWAWAGYSLGTPVVRLWGSRLDVARFRSFQGRLRRLANAEILFNANDVSAKACRSMASRLQHLDVDGIHGYANATYHLARHLDRQGASRSLRFVLTTAETLLPDRRDVIERVFECPVFDYYGSRETSMVSQPCARHDGYHVSVDNGVLEIVRSGSRVRPGERGDVLITDFRNHAMPLIRYEIGDVATASSKPCGCGLPFPTIASVEGRVSDQFVLRNGETRSPLMVTSLVYPDPMAWGVPTPEITNIRQWQFEQTDVDRFVVRLVLDRTVPKSDYEYIAGNLREHVDARADVRIEIVDEIETTRDGKRRPVISRVAR